MFIHASYMYILSTCEHTFVCVCVRVPCACGMAAFGYIMTVLERVAHPDYHLAKGPVQLGGLGPPSPCHHACAPAAIADLHHLGGTCRLLCCCPCKQYVCVALRRGPGLILLRSFVLHLLLSALWASPARCSK